MDVRRRFLGLQTNSSSGEDNIDSMYAAKYTTTNLQSITPYVTSPFDSKIVSHILDPDSGEFGIVCERAITKINNDAFKNKSTLKTFIPSNTVTVIGSNAFYGCSSLTKMVIPKSVTSIGGSAFHSCAGELEIHSPTLVETDYTSSNYPMYSSTYWLYGSKFTKLTIGSNVTKIGNYAFRACSALTSVTIPSNVISIGQFAFNVCNKLVSVTIPSNVNKIDVSTFSGCSSLASITIPESVTTIGSYAFYNCTSLTSITIPDKVTRVDTHAFYNCKALESVYCKPTTPPVGGTNMFVYNASNRKIYVPTASVNAYKTAQYWRDYADYIVGYDLEYL
ncbi:MAG: leucine-rich repeat protein [Erysipelotrichaceae bacterium]|nr:leucine-rich repeat protein [Erysipelotrichaceae bacterium]